MFTENIQKDKRISAKKCRQEQQKSRTIRKLECKKQAMLRNFRINEQDVDVNNDSMVLNESKQGPSQL